MQKVDKEFFKQRFPEVFKVPLKLSQEQGIFKIIDTFDLDDEMPSLRWLADILGTSAKESNWSFTPVVEGYYLPEKSRVMSLWNYYKKNNPDAIHSIFPNVVLGENGRPVSFGNCYYGRGAVTQLTHEGNYERASSEIFNDNRLVENPDLVLDLETDMRITFKGMREGWFTGHTLEEFYPIENRIAKWVQSRRIINGLNCANEIAEYKIDFYKCLKFVGDTEQHSLNLEEGFDIKAARAEAEADRNKFNELIEGPEAHGATNIT